MYKYYWYFLIFSFLGWVLEVIYASIKTKKFINRGFLNGAYCPIYGFGVVIVSYCLSGYKDSSLSLLFLSSFVLATILEFITGFILEKIFSKKWWDYSNYFLNIKGYVCILFSFGWGILCTIVVKFLLPVVDKIVYLIPAFVGKSILIFFIVLMIIDFFVTIIVLTKLSYPIKELQKVTKELKKRSNILGKKISKNTIMVMKKYDKIIKEYNVLKRRILKAFPDLTKK